MTGLAAVRGTPEKKQNQKAAQLPGSKPTVQKSTSELIVEDTMSSSFGAANNTDSQRRKPDPKPKGDVTSDSQIRLFRHCVVMVKTIHTPGRSGF